jgi:hypothetical protein
LLFVLSKDHGELSGALSLLLGHDFQSLLLMPEPLLAANASALPVPARHYAGVEDILTAVDAERPDLVLLFSGYLYAVNGLLDVAEVEALIGALLARGCRLATSDPFLGLLARLDGSTFSQAHPARAWLTAHFARIHGALRDLPHVYPVDMTGVSVPWVSFFNEHVLHQAEEQAGRVKDWPPADPDRRRWVFVLSQEDYGAQANLRGRARVDDLLAARLRDTAAAGRQPVLVGPPACVASVGPRVADVPRPVLLPFCDHGLFTALLLEAEHAFYWNVFSNSIPARAATGRTVFFFDRGHMARAIPPLFAEGMRRYYPGSTLTALDPARPLEATVLASLAARQVEAMRAARDAFRRSPPPPAMIARLLQAESP